MKTRILTISLLVAASIPLHAQILTQQIGGAGNPSVTNLFSNILLEDFFFDPDYDSQGRVVSYKLNNIADIRSTYNAERQLASKAMYVWSNNDNIYEKNLETIYTYNNGHLTGSTTYQYLTGGYDKSRTRIKSEEYTRNNNIETVTTHTYMEIGIPIDTCITIKYLNKKQLPDSIINYRLFDGERILVSCETRKYDKKDRCTFMSFSHQITLTEYYDDGGEQRFVDNGIMPTNEIDYLTVLMEQIAPKERSAFYTPVEKQMWYTISAKTEYKNNNVGIKYYDAKNREFLSLNVSRNKNERIIAQNISIDSEPLLTGNMQYNTEGRTIANKTINISNYYIRRLFPSNVRLNGIQGIKYETAYTKPDVQTCTLYRLRNNAAEKYFETETSFTPQGDVAVYKYINYYKGELDDNELYENTYDTEGRLLSQIHYEWNDEKNEYENYYKEQYAYDQNGYTTYYEKSRWDKDDNKWVGSYADKFEKIYDDAGNLLYELSYKWDDNKWIEHSKKIREYTRTGKLQLKEDYGYRNERDSIVYNEADEIDTKYRFNWDWQNEKWKRISKIMYSNTDSSSTEKIYEWKNNQWKPYQATTKMDRPDYSFVSRSEGGIGKQEWTETSRSIDHYVNGAKMEERHEWNSEKKELEGKSKTYTQGNIFDLSDTCIITYCKWNYDSKTWSFDKRISYYPSSSMNPKEPKEIIVRTLEKYDGINRQWVFDKKQIKEDTHTSTYEEMQLWDTKKNQWTNYKHVTIQRLDNKNKESELSLWNEKSQTWESYVKQTNFNYEYYTYAEWNAATKQWENKWKEEPDMLMSYYSKWDKQLNNWKELERNDDYYKNIDSIIEIFENYKSLFNFEAKE